MSFSNWIKIQMELHNITVEELRLHCGEIVTGKQSNIESF